MPDPMPSDTSFAGDRRQFAPAVQRNRDPIATVLARVLPSTGTILEIASGTGEHAAYFAPRFHPCFWLPTDPNPLAWQSVAAWRSHLLVNSDSSDDLRLLEPMQLDVRDGTWSVEASPPPEVTEHPIRALVCINMIHIAPWSACLGLLAGAERILPAEGVLYLYGPYKREGQHTAASNEAFDLTLRDRDASWGVRDLEAVVDAAEARGLTLQTVEEMPANNLSVVFQRASD